MPDHKGYRSYYETEQKKVEGSVSSVKDKVYSPQGTKAGFKSSSINSEAD